MSIPTSTLRTSLLHAALFTATAASGAEVYFNTVPLTTTEATTPANWVGSAFPGTTDIAAWMTDTDAVTAGNQESRGGILTIASPVTWLGLRHEDSVGPMTLTGANITLGASGITEVRWEVLTIQNNIALAASQTWTNTAAAYVNGIVSGNFGLTKAGTGTLTLGANNNYTGPTTITNGSLVATSLNSVSGGGGSAVLTGSSLGAPVTVADGTIGLGTTTQGILVYGGPGETTNRVINLAGTTGGGTITAETPGLLNFSSAVTATGAGAKGVGINGGGNGQIQGFPSNGGLTNLTKSGAGTWTLTGASSQAGGAVNVNGGILSYASTASRTTGTFTRATTGGGVLKIATGANLVTSTANTNGILGGWATVDNTTWAVANGASPVTGLTTYTNDTWAAGNNTDVTLAGADPAGSSVTNSLRLNTAGAKTLNLSGANKVTSGGILLTPAVGANTTTLNGGSLIRGAAADLTFHLLNAGGSVVANTLITDETPANRTGGTTSGTKVITGLSSTSDLTVGMTVTGTGIAASSTIATIDSATQITLNNNTTATGTPSLSFRFVTGLTKTGPGAMTLNGAHSYTGPTHVHDGELVVNGNSGPKVYTLSRPATLKLAYSTGNSVYGYGVTVSGTNTSATTGLYLNGGSIYNFQSGLVLQTGPTRVRAYGTGNPTLAGWDTGNTHLTVTAFASGSVIDSAINFTTSTYGYVMNITAGANNATGDVTFEGTLTSASNANGAHYRKTGNGSLTLSGQSTNTAPVDIREGSVILTGGNDRIGTGAAVYLGNGSNSGKLILNGINQRLANLTMVGTGTTNAAVGGSATPSILSVNYTGAGQSFGGTLGGTGTNENNLTFEKAGTGTYTLTGTNTYTGGTIVTEGMLALGSAGALGSSGLISMNGGTLQFGTANTTDYSSRLRIEDGVTATFDTNGQNVAFASALQTGVVHDGGLNKIGAGTLSLGGNNTYTGGTTVTAGTLQLDYSASNTSKLADNGVLKLAGGTINLVGGNHVEIVDSTELTTAAAVSITRTSGGSVLNLGVVTRNSTGTLDFAAPGIARVNMSNDSSGKLPAWITIAGAPASVDGSGNVVAYSGFADVNRLGGKLPNNANANVRIVNGGTSGNITPLVAGKTNISSLLQNASAGPAVIDLGGTNTLRLAAVGSVIVPGTSGALTVQQGHLTAGGGDDLPGEIAVDADGSLTLDAAIEDNGLGAVTVSKIGTGSLTLSQSNAHTGGTILNQGQLRVNHAEALGLNAPLTIAGGSLDNTSGAAIVVDDTIPQTWDADFSFAGTNNLRFNAGTATLTDNRAVTVTAGELGLATVAGAYNLTKNGAGTLFVATNGVTGTTTVNDGVLEVQARTNNDAPYVVSPTGTLRVGYSTGGGYANTGLKINGAGVAATTGFYLEGGSTYNVSGNMELLTAPTTIRQFGTGLAGIGQFDINGSGLIVSAAASGSVIDSNVEFISRGYGMSMDVASGANTATGDLVMNGRLNVNAATYGLYKRGAGSLLLNAAATTTNMGLKIQAGSVITGIDNAIGDNAELPISSGAKLVMNGHSQAAASLSGAGQVLNGSATPAALTLKQGSDQTFSGVLGGAGANDGNFSLVKGGASKLTLSGANNYKGSTTVNDGTLAVTTTFLADTEDVKVNGAGTLELATASTDVIDQLIVDDVPQAPGIYGAIGSGAQFERTYITGNGKLSVTTGAGNDYNSWEASNGITGAGSGADSDGDGVSNGIEFVIGGDPSGPNSDSRSLLPTATTDATYINFAFRRTDAAAAYNPYVQYGSTLASWTQAQGGVGGVIVSEENDFYGAGTDRVTVKIPRTLAVGGKLFARLRVDIP